MRIVVVGAGAVGLACAYELCQDGHDVVVLDGSSAGQAASHGNAAKIAVAEVGPVPAPGMVVQGLKWMLKSDSPLYVKPSVSPPFVRFMLQMARNCTEEQFRYGLDVNLRLACQSNDLLDEWRTAGLQFEMHQRGVLLAYEDAKAFDRRLNHQDVFSAYGVEPEVLDARGVHHIEPALSERITRGLFYPEDRQVEPDSLIRALVEYISKLGGLVHENAAVTGFDSTSAGVTGVRTGDGQDHACDGVVLAAGVWTPALARQFGVEVPIQPGKGYSIDYTPTSFSLRTSITFEDAHVAVTPLDGMIRVAGTMEFSGLSQSLNRTRIAAIERAAAEGLRDWDPNGPHRPAWAGMRPMTPDGLPVIGQLSEGLNVWVASGHAMLGLAQAPGTAREIRGLIRGGGASQHPGTNPNRFRRRTQDNSLKPLQVVDKLHRFASKRNGDPCRPPATRLP